MNFIEPLRYKYAMNVKLSQVPARTILSTVFPSAEDMVISSKIFDKFEDAVESSNKLVAEVTQALNTAMKVEQYSALTELNPKLTGKETISKDWAPTEMAKLWIIDQVAQKTKPGPIRAVGLAQLVEVHDEPVPVN